MYFVLIVLFPIGAARQSWCDAILATSFLPSAARNNVLPLISYNQHPDNSVGPEWAFSVPSFTYHQTFDIRHTLVGDEILDHSDVVGASPVGAAPTTSSFSTKHLASMDWAKTSSRQDKKH